MLWCCLMLVCVMWSPLYECNNCEHTWKKLEKSARFRKIALGSLLFEQLNKNSSIRARSEITWNSEVSPISWNFQNLHSSAMLCANCPILWSILNSTKFYRKPANSIGWLDSSFTTTRYGYIFTIFFYHISFTMFQSVLAPTIKIAGTPVLWVTCVFPELSCSNLIFVINIE